MASLFKTDIRKLKGVGEKTALAFNKLGVNTIGELINFYPRTYEDWTFISSVSNSLGKKDACLKVKITSSVSAHRLKGGKFLYKVCACDGFENLNITFFNSKYSAEKLIVGKEYLLRGAVTRKFGSYEMGSPKIKDAKDNVLISPVYPQCKGVTSSKIFSFVKTALGLISNNCFETLPQEILKQYNLCPLKFALDNIHSPVNKNFLRQARNRIIFEEFLIYRLSIGALKEKSRQKTKISLKKDCREEFYKLLPFKITDAQRKAVDDCIKDIAGSGLSMNRLLQGDVGSGKTAVAATLAYVISKNEYQSVIMAPTELLAFQHYNTFCKFFSDTSLKVELITGSMSVKERKAVQEKILSGEADIIIGTHALVSEKTKFRNVGLMVTDEQHRFGVKQRAALINKGEAPHVLVMSATPIPRTLAMILYGDLDVSVLNGLLPGREKTDTYKIATSERERVFEFVKKTIKDSGQAYVVCACIEDNENDILDVESYRKLMIHSGFSSSDVDILHGKMLSSEKDAVMKKFINGDIKVLISTTVIEVGIDVPNATVIIIENAERFGISQLHQLRGRVGRGNKKSYCILVSDSKSKDSSLRFSALVNSSDGFYLSEEDLKIRGPGDFFGVNQHGVPNVKIATSYEDVFLAQNAEACARDILLKDPLLESSELKFIKRRVINLFGGNIFADCPSENVVF